MVLYINCLKRLENPIVSVTSQVKSTWMAILVGESCSRAWVGDHPRRESDLTQTQQPRCPCEKENWHDLRGVSCKGHGSANPPALPGHSRPCSAPRALHSFWKKLSSAKKQGHSKPALWFWRKDSKPGYEFLKVEDCQTFIKAVLKFSVTSTSACINRAFFSKSTVVCFYLHHPLMSLLRGLEMLLSSITTKV